MYFSPPGCIRMTPSLHARMFMLRALEKIYAEREIRRSHHSQLKRAVEQALGECHKDFMWMLSGFMWVF